MSFARVAWPFCLLLFSFQSVLAANQVIEDLELAEKLANTRWCGTWSDDYDHNGTINLTVSRDDEGVFSGTVAFTKSKSFGSDPVKIERIKIRYGTLEFRASGACQRL